MYLISNNKDNIISNNILKEFSSLTNLKYSTIKYPDCEISLYFPNFPQVINKAILLLTDFKNPNENILELYFILEFLEQKKCQNLTLIIPYFFYSRHDRKFFPHSLVQLKSIAKLLNNRIFITNLIIFDLHNAATIRYFNCQVFNLSPSNILYDFIKTHNFNLKNILLVGPDAGSTNRIKNLASLLKCNYIILEKKRQKFSSQLSIKASINKKISDIHCVIYDDIIDTGNTLVKTAEVLHSMKALSIMLRLTLFGMIHPILNAYNGN